MATQENIQIISTSAEPSPPEAFTHACRTGDASAATAMARSAAPAIVAQGMEEAALSGHEPVLRVLLQVQPSIAPDLPAAAARAPLAARLPLFQTLTRYGWHPNDAGYYGTMVLPLVVGNEALVRWLLEQGADPTLGPQRLTIGRDAGPDRESAAALDNAAEVGSPVVVRLLLEHGARLETSVALHRAAGACPAGENLHSGRVRPTREFDRERIAVMEVLVAHGADVNGVDDNLRPHVTPGTPLVYAVMAGAVERVRWLLDQGADPTLQGPFGSAEMLTRSDLAAPEMKEVMRVGLAARKWAAINVESGAGK